MPQKTCRIRSAHSWRKVRGAYVFSWFFPRVVVVYHDYGGKPFVKRDIGLVVCLEYPPGSKERSIMEEALPYVTAALFCERVIEGKDGILSAIRIIDNAQVQLLSDVPSVVESLKAISPAIQVTALICLKSGPVKGKFNLDIFGEKPSGKRAKMLTFLLDLQGEDHGQTFVVNVTIAVDEDGLHWFHIIFDDRLLTKIPLRLTRLPAQEGKSVES